MQNNLIFLLNKMSLKPFFSKFKKILFILGLLTFSFSFYVEKNTKSSNEIKLIPQNKSLKKIIIDPGHGGNDQGAEGKYSTEAQVCLAIALKLEQYLKKNLPDVEIVLTRSTDLTQTVGQKANIANDNKGDLFISIHTNSASGGFLKQFIGMETKTYYVKKGKNKIKKTQKVRKYKYTPLPSNARGTETYIYNVNKSDERLDVAIGVTEDMFEDLDSNSIEEIEDLNKKLDSDPSQKILASILTQQFFQRSAALALTIEDEFSKAGRISREAKQRTKGIWVLQAVTMPAVLVETGFISNKEEEDYLNSEEGQDQICQAITKAVIRYKNSLDKY